MEMDLELDLSDIEEKFVQEQPVSQKDRKKQKKKKKVEASTSKEHRDESFENKDLEEDRDETIENKRTSVNTRVEKNREKIVKSGKEIKTIRSKKGDDKISKRKAAAYFIDNESKEDNSIHWQQLDSGVFSDKPEETVPKRKRRRVVKAVESEVETGSDENDQGEEDVNDQQAGIADAIDQSGVNLPDEQAAFAADKLMSDPKIAETLEEQYGNAVADVSDETSHDIPISRAFIIKLVEKYNRQNPSQEEILIPPSVQPKLSVPKPSVTKPADQGALGQAIVYSLPANAQFMVTGTTEDGSLVVAPLQYQQPELNVLKTGSFVNTFLPVPEQEGVVNGTENVTKQVGGEVRTREIKDKSESQDTAVEEVDKSRQVGGEVKTSESQDPAVKEDKSVGSAGSFVNTFLPVPEQEGVVNATENVTKQVGGEVRTREIKDTSESQDTAVEEVDKSRQVGGEVKTSESQDPAVKEDKSVGSATKRTEQALHESKDAAVQRKEDIQSDTTDVSETNGGGERKVYYYFLGSISFNLLARVHVRNTKYKMLKIFVEQKSNETGTGTKKKSENVSKYQKYSRKRKNSKSKKKPFNWKDLNLTDAEMIAVGKNRAETKSGYEYGNQYDFREFFFEREWNTIVEKGIEIKADKQSLIPYGMSRKEFYSKVRISESSETEGYTDDGESENK